MSFELKHPTVEDLKKDRKYWVDTPHVFASIVPGSFQCVLCRLREHNPIHDVKIIDDPYVESREWDPENLMPGYKDIRTPEALDECIAEHKKKNSDNASLG